MKMAALVVLLPVGRRAGRARRSRVWCLPAAAARAEPGPARLLGDPVRVLIGREQQRIGVRGPGRQRTLLRHRARRVHARRALLGHRARARRSGIVGAQEDRASDGRHAPDRHSAVRPAAGGHRPAGRRADLRSRAGARSRRRAPALLGRRAEGRHDAETDVSPRDGRSSSPERSRTLSASSIRARSTGTRSCSWSRSAARSPRCCSSTRLATGAGEAPAPFILAVSVWLWFTVLFGNFAEAMAEGRGKAQADAPAPGSQGGGGKTPGRAAARRSGRRRSCPRACGAATSCWWRRATSSRRRRGGRGDRLGRRKRDHRRERPGDPRERRATAAPSPGAPGCCPTGSSSASPRTRVRPSSTA